MGNSQYCDAAMVYSTSGEAFGVGARLKIVDGKTVKAGVGATDEVLEVGTAYKAATDVDQSIPFVPRSAHGSVTMIAAGEIAIGATVYGAAAGKVSTTESGAALGVAISAAADDGDLVEVIRT